MNRLYKATFSLLFLMSGLLAGHRGYAEGSKDLYPSGIAGGRAFLVSTTATKTGWTLTNKGVHYAYLKVGETLGAASSAQGIGSGQIILTAPDGSVYSSTVGSTTTGQIASRTQELQGPWVGYTPFSRVVGAGQAGLWKIELVSTNPPGTIAEGTGANAAADAAWTQNTASSAIAAWDVSVRSAGGTIIPGRVYTNVLNMYVSFGNYRGVIYVLTKDGYVYKVNNNGSSGIGFVAFVNNKGLTTNATDAGEPIYKSVAGTNPGTDFNTWDPRSDDGASSITHKMFYNIPATDMPASSIMPGGKTTWLRGAKIIPSVANISVDGVEGTSGQVSKKGAYIKFTASVGGTYRISLVGSGSFVTRKMTGTAVAGNNSIFWDGKDGAGVAPALGTASVTANIQLQGAEIHFPFIDVEDNPNGLIIEQLNDDNSVKSDIVYWDDVSFANATGASNPRSNGNSGSGISSNTNGHKWSTNFGDMRTMDTWTYILGDMVSQNTTLNIVEADLAIQSVAPATPTTQVAVGKPVTYKVVVVNNGPSDVTGAPFTIKVPAGFTIADLSAITASTSCGTVKNAALDASGNYTALLDLPNGCIITFNLTGTAGPSLVGGNINIETSIMRPKDVTDPDATNPDAAVPPTDPHLECKNGGTTETCNNIKYNSGVAVVASADIVVVKTIQNAAKTTYSPGETVNYVFTVTNNGPSTATNVNVTDVAPAGTSITAWTATAAGPVALPHTSGVGNINETIASIPAGEVVTYVVQVTLPAAYNSALSNTASASSPVLDETPGNNSSTTTPITLEQGADIATVKVVQDAAKTTYAPGEDVIYTITVTNNGPGDAKDVNIKDVAPVGTTIKDWSASVVAGTVSPLTANGMGDIDQIITSMSNGAVVKYVVTVSVPADHTGNLSNTATGTTGSRDDVPGNNNSTSGVLTPAPKADIAVVKTTAATAYTPGEEVTYTIVVSNNGPSDAQNVRVQDTAPTGTTISAWTAAVTSGTVTLPATSGIGDLDEMIATLPNGAAVTYTITIATQASLTGALSNTATATSPVTDNTPGNNTSTTTGINPSPKADVSVVKTTTATSFTPGQDVVYTITVTNNGPSDAKTVNVSDVAPAGTTISAWSAAVITGTVTLPGTSGTGNLNETIATLPNGAVVTYTVTVSVPASFTANLSNAANVTSTTPDNDPTDNSSTTPGIPPAAIADIVTVKQLKDPGQTTFVPGEDVVYVITVTNNGPSDAKNVNVNDIAPAGTTISAWTAAVTTGTVTLPNTSGTGNLNETIATFPDGAVVSYEVTVTTPASFSGNLSNTAVVTSGTTDPTPGNNNNTSSSTTPAPKADVAIVKTTTATTYTPGQDVVYTITVTNNGPSDAKNVNVSDIAPAGTTISAWAATVTTGTVTLPNTSGTGNLNETIGTLPNGAVVTYAVTVDMPASSSATISNTASVSSTTPDDDLTDNSSTSSAIAASPKADVSVVKTTTATSFTPGQDVVYIITVTNNGPSDAKTVNVSDVAPAGTIISAWSAAVTTGTVTLPNTSGTGNLNETIATLPNGAVVTYTVTVSVPASFTANLSNAANVTSTTPDNDPTDNSSTTPGIPPAAIADIVTVKQLKDPSQTTFVPGQDVVYVITVTNNGPSDAKTVNVNDVAPAGTTISAWTAAVTNGTVTLPNSSGTGNLNETIATFPDGAVVTYEVTVKTPASFSGNLSNTAVVTSGTTDPTPGNNNNTSSSTTPAPKADVAIVKTTTATNFTPGQDVVYTITVTNNGPSDAKNVNVSDIAPAGTTISAWAATVTTGTVTLPNTSGTGNLNETIGTLPNGAVVIYAVTVGIPASFSATISNTANVASTTPDDDLTDNSSTSSAIAASPKADVSVVKTTTATSFTPGQDVVYTITVSNNGPSDAKTVNVTDVAPVGTTISAWSAAVTTGTVTLPNTSGTGNLNETIATLPNGAVVTYIVTVSVPASFTANLSNAANVTSTTPDNDPTDNSSTTPGIPAAAIADIVTVKQLKDPSQTTFVPGQDVVYVITVTNNGPSDAKNVNINDVAPAGTTISAWTAAVTNGTVTLPNSSGTGNLNETITTFPDGAVVTYEVTVKTPASFSGNLSNTAVVTSGTTDPTPGNNNNTSSSTTPAPKADISVVKTTTATTYTPGQDVVYTITVTNNGPSDAKTVNVSDIAPAGTTISAWTATVTNGTVTLPNTSGTGNLNETIATLPNGAVVTYTVTVSVPASFTANLSNAANVTSTTPDNDPTDNSSTTPGIPAAAIADIVTMKQLKDPSQTTFVPGQDVVYVITVTNNGPSDAKTVNIKDDAPAGTTISAWTATVTTGTLTLPNTSGTGNLNETIATFPDGAVVTYEVTVKTPASFSGNLSNTAVVTSGTTDPTPGNNNNTSSSSTPSPKADVSVVKTTTATNFTPGQNVVYTITVSNNGPSDAKTVIIKDTAPAGTTISAWNATVTTGTVTLPNTSGTGNLNETIATLPNGAVVTYAVTVAVPASFTANLSNTATATSTTPDDDPTDNSSITPGISPAAIADIVTVKQLKDPSQTTFIPGQDVLYVITVTNNGPSDAKTVNIKDDAPAGTSISAWSAAVTTGTVTLPHTSGTGNLNETIATFPDGAIVTYEVTVKTPASFSGNLSNTAVVTSGTTDPTPGNNNNTSSTSTPAAKADVSVVKTTTATSFTPGQSVVYTITVTNNGPSDAKTVNIKDNAPTGTTITAWKAAVTAGAVTLPNTSGAGNLNETIATLPNGAVVTYAVTVAVPASFTANLSNTATATTTSQDDDQTDNSSTTPGITPAAIADIVTVKKLKDAGQTTFVPGEDVVYVITVTNNGPSDAKTVNIKDAAPAGTTISAWTAAVTTGTVTLPATSGAGNLDETIATFPDGAIVTYEVTVKTPASFSGNLSNTAVVTSGTADPTPGNNNNTSASTTPAPKADVAVVKQLKNAGQTTFSPGTAVVYTIKVTNNGPSDANAVNIKDAAPAGTTISAWTAAVTTGTVTLPNTNGTGNLNETIATLPDGATVTYEVTVMTPADFTGTLSNSAAVQSSTPDATPGNNTSTTPGINPAPSADIVTVKRLKNAAQTTFVAGKEVVYMITITNNGPGDAANVHIKDIAPAGTTISSWTATVTNGTVTLPKASGTGDLDETIAVMPNAAVVTYEVVVLTPEGFTGTLVNVAAVTSETPDPTPACPACAAAPVTPEPLPVAATDNHGDTRADIPVTIPVLNNDTPGNANTPLDPASLEIVQQPAHGSVIVNEDGTVVYTPEKGYTGPDAFTYKVKDQNGNWSNVATVNLNIIPNEVEVPNVITPNGDGSNDKLVIKGLEKFVQNEIVIYNRWNNVLFRKQNYQGEWDGQGLNAGTYYYTLKGLDANGQWHTYNGYIMLLR